MRAWLGQVRVREIVVAAVLVFFGLAGAVPGIAPNQSSEMTGVPASHLQAVVGVGSQMAVDLILVALLIRNARMLRLEARRLLWPLALAGWTVVSAAWSVAPALTVRRSLPFLLAAAFGALLSLQLPVRRLLWLLQIAFAVLACWSAVLAIGFPSVGLDASTGHGGDWQGVFTQKNACGRAMVLAVASVLASLPAPRAGRRTLPAPQAALLALFGAELLLSGSRGAWLIGAVVTAGIGGLWVTAVMDVRARVAVLAGAGVAAAAGAWGGAMLFTVLAPMMGRDASLTGRTAIWREVWRAIEAHPWIGYGFSAFWQGMSGASWSVVLALHFVLFHAHNGFLEIWLELGAAGLAIFLGTLARGWVLLWPELRAGNFAEAAWPAALLLLAVLYDLDENTLLSFNGLFWVLYTGGLTRIELLAAQRRGVRRGRAAAPQRRPWRSAAPPAADAWAIPAAGPRNIGAQPWL